ncbi:hypothetical protein AB6N23_05880 [Cellulomonas sp. 179-A 9B4 NHS]|uniref:hypothetical protein n=1 Tax=Cellulomonas sp. 179-A 9B4 NHS TaxID=3142379 RepID=UPI00399FE22C
MAHEADVEGATSFDVSKEVLERGGEWPGHHWSTPALLRLVKTEALEPPRRDPRRRIMRVTTALARLGERGIPADAVVRTCLGPALVRQIIIEAASIWVLTNDGRLPRGAFAEMEAWMDLFDSDPALTGVDRSSLPEVVSATITGDVARRAREWLRDASMAHVLSWRLDGYLKTDVEESDIMLPAGVGATLWVSDRFTETYLDKWSRESLEWELVFLHEPVETAGRVGLAVELLRERPVTMQQIVDALSRRLSGAVGDDPVAHGLRTEEIIHAIVGMIRDGQQSAAQEMAARAVRQAPENGYLCNVLAFCLIPVNSDASHQVLDRLIGTRDARVRATVAMNRATLYIAEKNASMARAIVAEVPNNGWQVWCWAPDSLDGEPRLLATSFAEWRTLANAVIDGLNVQDAG